MASGLFSHSVPEWIIKFLLLVLVFVWGFYVNSVNDQLTQHLHSTPNTYQQPPQTNQAQYSQEPTQQTTPPDRILDRQLQEILQDHATNHPGEYGITVREVTKPKRYASYQQNKQFVSASLYKLFLIYNILENVQNNQLSLRTSVPNNASIGECIDSLLLVSSDVCAWRMGTLIGWDSIDNFLQNRGLEDTVINNYDSAGDVTSDKQTTARDTSELLWRLANDELLNEKHTEIMLSNMKEQVHRERIPAGVPDDITVANKPGWLYEQFENDAGIVYGENSTYVVSILTYGATIRDIARLSEKIYNYLN